MALIFPLPTDTPDGDIGQYVPFLIAGIDVFIESKNYWNEADYEAAYDYMENLKTWVMENIPCMVQTYPKRAVMWHDEAKKTVGSGLTPTVNASQLHNTFTEMGTPAVNDAFSHSFFLPAGTYDLDILGVTQNVCGIVTWKVDGSTVASDDFYTSATVFNVVKHHSGIVIATDGYHKFEGVVLSKNASSSNFRARLTKYWFSPSAD